MQRHLIVLSFALLAIGVTTCEAQNIVSGTRFSRTRQFSTQPPTMPQRGYGFDWYQGRPGTWTGNAIYRTYRPMFPLYQTRNNNGNATRAVRRRRR